MEALTEKLSKKLQLPTKAETQPPTKPIQLFPNWVKNKTTKVAEDVTINKQRNSRKNKIWR
jgi:hypothetical protein